MSDSLINTNLGSLLEEFKLDYKKIRASIIFGIISTIVGMGISIFIILRYRLNSAIIFYLILAGILPILLGLFFIISFSIKVKKGLSLSAYNNGLYYKEGSSEKIINWDDITEFFYHVTKNYRNGIYTGTTYIFTIKLTDNKKITFDNNITNIAKLGEILRQKTTNTLLPKFSKRFNEGETINFGNIKINKIGISNGKDVIPWKEVKDFKLVKGIITIKKEGKWLNWSTLNVGFIPNLFVLLSFVDSVIGINKNK